jgi:hypothetical protein
VCNTGESNAVVTSAERRVRDQFCANPRLIPSSVIDRAGTRPFQFRKRSQLFLGTHDKTLSFAVRVNDPNCAPIIVQAETQPTLNPALIILLRSKSNSTRICKIVGVHCNFDTRDRCAECD